MHARVYVLESNEQEIEEDQGQGREVSRAKDLEGFERSLDLHLVLLLEH